MSGTSYHHPIRGLKNAPPPWTWLAVAVGFAVRIWFSRTSGLYLDEAQVLGISAQPELSSLLQFLAQHEAHPPLYYLLLRGWMDVFGPYDSAAVALSLVLGTITILLAFCVVNGVTESPADGTAAAWLVALSPTAVRYSGMVRPYALLGLVLLAMFWLLLDFLRSGRWRHGLGYAASGIVLVYTHNWSWLVLAATGSISLCWLGLHKAPRKQVYLLVGSYGLIGALYLPWLPSFLQQISGAGHFFVKSLGSTLAEVAWVLTGVTVWSALLVASAVVLLAKVHRRRSSPPALMGRGLIGLCISTIVLTSTLAFLLSPVTPLLISQCYAMFTPALMAALAVGVGVGRPPRFLSSLVLIVCLLMFCGRIAVMSGWVRSDVREIALFLQDRVEPRDLVLIYPDYPAPTLSRYYTPRGEVFTNDRPGLPSLIPFDRRVPRDRDRSALESTKAEIVRVAQAGRRIWYLTIENPADYPPLRFEVERALEAHLGRPTCIFAGSTRPRLYEDMHVVLYGGRPGSGPIPPCT